ncbi:MAG TPA: RDD family protein [Anaerolineales bacterium]|nr:RDD family protein [Anaerolineales bacterium]
MNIAGTALPEATRQAAGKGFGVRAAAYVIDVIVIWVVTIVISLFIGIIIGIVFSILGQELVFAEQGTRGIDFLIGFVTSTLYFIIFEWLYGATPGKLILSMRVLMEDGRHCTFGAACIRALLRYIDGLLFGIPAYASMKEPLLQRIGDKAAKTVVVGAKDPFIRKARAWWWFALALVIYLGMETIAASIQTISMLR